MIHPTKRAAQYFIRILLAAMLLLLASVANAQNTISTVAGGPPLNNVSPTAAPLVGPQAVVRDGSGNLYVVNDNGVIYKVVNQPGVPSTMVILAGNNTAGFSPNGTAAASTLTDEPYGAALDANGNLYYSDSQNCAVRKIAGGVVETVAGNGSCGFSGDGGQATSASLGFLQGIALDGLGNLFIADAGNAVIRRVVLATGIITTYAGTPDTQGFPTSGVSATSTPLGFPAGVATDANGNLFIADEGDNVVCRVDVTSKIITIVAGTGAASFSGDGGPATSATLNEPDGLAVDSAGNIYISDALNAVVREVSASGPNAGEIQTIVGNTTFGFSGDGGPALSAELTNPAGLFVDSSTGNLWIADFWANRIRLYSPGNNKQITTVVGNGLVGDGGPATSASFYFPRTPQLDSEGNLYIVDAENDRIRKVDTSGNITTVVGTGIPCARPSLPCGDGGLATSALIFMPRTVTIEANGDLLVSDDGDNRIREVSGGIINTIVGSGNQCGSGQGQVPLPCGDGGPALSASVNDARGAVRDAAGNLYFVDAQDNRVREVNTGGTIATIAGGGANDTAPTGCANGTYTGDGGPAVNATLNCPLGLDIDSLGNLYVADTHNNVIRKIDTGSPRIITTIAGTGAAGHTGDGGLATSATLNSPDRVSVNGAGNFFISDSGNNVIRRVDGTSKIITAFAGNGTFAFAGDGGPALSASFATPVGVVVTPEGNMYVGDVLNNRIRKVLLNPNIALSSSTAAFSNQPINVAATSQPVTVTNSGDAPLTISSIALTGDSVFSLATSASPCPVAPATLAVGANCVIEVAFTPTQFVTSTGTITITDNAPTTTQTINVSGTGAAALTVQVTAGTGSVTSSPAGITACATTCTANFTGNSSVTLTAAPGTNFTFSGFTNCASTGALTCSVTMSASETVTATFTAGSGIPPALAITKTHTGNFTQGQQGATYTVTVSNGANAGPTSGTMTVTDTIPAGLTLVSMAGAGWTCATNTCTNSNVLLPGANSVITVTVNVASNAAASVTNSVSVSGGGSATANATNPTTVTTSGGGGGSGIATVNPNPLAFGGVQAGVPSTLSFTLQNTGTGPLGSIAFSVTNTDYTITTNTCATSLAAGSAPCTLTVTFTPSFQAPDTGAVVITDDSSAGPTTELLSGAGVGPIYVLPFEMFYDGITPGTTSPAQTATLFNTTDTGLSVTGVTFVGNAASDFSVTSNGCGDGADPSCPIGVAFTPSTTVLGPRTADLTIATNSEETPSVVSHLTGNGAIRHLPGFTGNSFPPNDDDSTSAVNLPFPVNFFGTTYNQLYVNNNGNVTFGEPFGTYTPFGLTGNIGVPIIAPFFADVYTLTPGSDVVHYGVDTVNGQQAFGVNWENVAYFAEPEDGCPPAILLNSFQLIVIARPDTGAGNFDMEFNYDKIQWETGSASGGTCGLGGSSAAVGYSNGTGDAGTNFQLPGSLVNGALLDVPTAAGFPGLIHSDLSSTMLGRYEFQVRNGAVQSADLGLTMTQSANPVPAGSNQTYTLTVTNAGPSDATNTTVSDTLPTNARLVSATPSQGAACTGTVTLTCNLGTVANAGSATVTIVVTVNAGATGTVVNNASVTSDLPDPNPGNNTASASATIGASTNVLLTITLGGNGTGTVRSTPAGINCGATCSFNFASGTSITLTATPSDGSTFTGWGAGPCEGTGTCTFTITAATTVVANFAQSTNNFTLTVNEAGTGTGTVSSAPAGINCPTTCSASFASGQVVVLTAAAATGSTFAGWSGAGCTGTGTCSVTMSAAEAVTATFNRTGTNFTLTVTEAGTGTGTVTSSPAGIACQPTCSASFTSGQVVTLMATAASGSTFAGWSGVAGCPGTGTCTVTVSAAETVTATFNSSSPVIITVAPGSPSTVVTSPGSSAVFGLTLTGTAGTTGTVQLGCTSSSLDITCNIVPSSIVLTGTAVNVAIVVQTFCKGAVPGFRALPGGFAGGLAILLASMSLCGAMWTIKRRPRLALSFGVLILIAVGMSACSSLPTSPGGQATPPGSYPLVVTATAPNGAKSSVNLVLKVQ